MRTAQPASTPTLVQHRLRDRLQTRNDLRTRLQHLLSAGGESGTRTVTEVLRLRGGRTGRGG